MRSLIVSIIGPTNAGKSTFLNKVIGQKISIVTPKVQTTRYVINGSAIYENTHIIFLDTPGLFDAKTNLDRYMVRSAWSSIASSDVVLIFLDGSSKCNYEEIVERVKQQEIPYLICLNKSDKPCIYDIENAFSLSAKSGIGIVPLLDNIIKFSTDRELNTFKITTLSMQFICAEITREKVFLCVNQELPYNLKVQHEHMVKKGENYYEIHQLIVTNSEGHKKMIIGAHGAMIKKIGILAREEMEKLYGVKVNLKLFIKVIKNWLDRDWSPIVE